MDMFYDNVPIVNKRRFHYNDFMLQIHMAEHKVNQLKVLTSAP